MNWFKHIIAAGGFAQYLRGLGVSEDVIQYIETVSVDENARQQLVNESRKNPFITVQQLSQMPLQQKTVDPYTQVEYSVANYVTSYAPFLKWILVELKRHRFHPMKGAEPKDSVNDPSAWTKFYNLDCFRNSRQGGHSIDAAFMLEMREIVDWAQQTSAQLGSYTFETAIVASDQWHEEMATSGEGTRYTENNIVYGPKWSGKDFEGWTIQEVRTKNDLDCEGNKMDHCVGSYAARVERGSTRIFSLRDPNNEPHVTIETDKTGKNVSQIRGKSNHEPKPLYRQMIAEWVKSGQGPTHSDDYYSSDDDEISDDLIKTIDEASSRSDLTAVMEAFGKGEDVYGLQHVTSLPRASDTFEVLMNKLMGKRRDNNHYSGWMKSVAVGFVELYSKTPGDLRDMQKFLEDIENTYSNSLLDYSAEMVGEPYPSEEDFDDENEYNKAVERFQKKEEEAMDYYWNHELPYAFIIDCWQSLNEVMAKQEAKPSDALQIPA